MTENNTYDYIVIGIGGIGSAAVYWLKKLAPNARLYEFFDQLYYKLKKNFLNLNTNFIW
jgi:hypothetical protein